ncbi:hypothetical protein VKA52_12755 [Halobacillus sp. HZG1]|uniref:hypothetical protein n=1 Tax=Halobacillus sp. HZG1 TaxID=3111769 RepID=UPI002DB74F5F|nr:hypothetical protein [Halobacillus sp. HZG1]MEC3884596.1 hypothetical protein [Halobacillus sp. HZG1]
MNQYIPAIITASVALLAAIGAQFLSHFLNSKREKNKEKSEVYQEFIYPFLPEVLLYYHTETNFRKGHDVEKEVSLNSLLEKISLKVSYGNMKLLTYYYEARKYEYFFDGRGWSKERNLLRFLFWFLDYSANILKGMKPREEEMYKEVIKTQKLYGIWVLVSEELEFDNSIEFMKYDFLLSDQFLKEINLKRLKKLVDNDFPQDDDRIRLLKEIISVFEEEDIGTFPILDELKEHIERNH